MLTITKRYGALAFAVLLGLLAFAALRSAQTARAYYQGVTFQPLIGTVGNSAQTGTLYSNHASIVRFARDLQDRLILENHNSTTSVQVLFNEADTVTSLTTTVSTTKYDLQLAPAERVVLDLGQGRFPLHSMAVANTTTTAPKLSAKGW